MHENKISEVNYSVRSIFNGSNHRTASQKTEIYEVFIIQCERAFCLVTRFPAFQYRFKWQIRCLNIPPPPDAALHSRKHTRDNWIFVISHTLVKFYWFYNSHYVSFCFVNWLQGSLKRKIIRYYVTAFLML